MDAIINNTVIGTTSYLQIVKDNLSSFIQKIDSLRDTYMYSQEMLSKQLFDAEQSFDSFVKPYSSINEKGETNINIPKQYMHRYKGLCRKKEEAKTAASLLSQSFIVSLISVYDVFIAGLVRCMYSLCPEKLDASEKQFVYKDFRAFQSIDEIRENIIEKNIEDVLRESHTTQFEWLRKELGLKKINDFNGWKDFVELTERRNLFVHTGGIVSTQYLSECQRAGYPLVSVVKGCILSADNGYFNESYKLLYEIAVKLTILLVNKIYLPRYGNNSTDVDDIFIENIYELICAEHYDVAINLSQFAFESHFHHKSKEKCYLLLNMAQAYKWSGNQDECLKTLDVEESRTWMLELKIPKLVLQNQLDEALLQMKKLGSNNEILTISSYREWPIFKELRKHKDFEVVFNEIFKEELTHDEIINTIQNSDSTITTQE